MMSALPPRSGESPSRRAGGVSRLAMMQARFQAKQLEEKEEKLIHMLEEKQDEMIQRVNHGRDSVNSVNSLSSTASSNSMNGSTGQRPGINGKQNGGGGKVRQMFEQRRNGGKVSPVGWDKSYPLEPVEAINSDIGGMTRSGMYKQNVTRQNSNTSSKYGGNYGPKTPAPNQGDKRGLSLDRVNRGRTSQGSFGYGQSTSMVRAQSQANIQGYGYQNTPTHQRVRKASGGSVSGRYSNYDVSPDESPPMQRRSNYGQVPSQERDYTRPMPPTYRRQGRQTGTGSRVGDPSPSRQSYRDSAYSSHSSHSSDNPNFPVIATNPRGAPPLSTQSSPSKTFSRQNSFTSESNTRTINSRTFRKQKSPLRNRSPSVSPSRSVENSDETDPEINNEYENRVASRTAEREREEERRRMQVEMRKREQELLARIKEQQKELDSVKAEKSKVEKQLTRQEREMEEERRKMFDRERILEEEKHQRQLEEKERKIQGERDEKMREEQDQVDSHEPRRRDQDLRSKPHDRVLMRDKASPAHLRGKRPPSLSRIRVPSRGPSREPSFDNEDDRDSVSSGGRSNKISNHNNSVNIEIKNTSKKNVPPSPSPAVKKKAPPRRSVFAPKPRDDLNSCKHCGRNFAEDRIEKHEEICLKTTQKKRKVFDMTKTRTKGTDAAKYVKSAAQMKAQEAKDEKKSNWRKKREEFVATLRAAKEAQKHLANGGSLKDLPPPPPMDTSDYIQCPHCSRRFAEAAADRHIPKCKDIKSNKKN